MNLAPLQGAGHLFARNPGVSLRSTPGYGLTSLRDALVFSMDDDKNMRLETSSGTPSGCGAFVRSESGGVAALNPRLRSGIPAGWTRGAGVGSSVTSWRCNHA